MWLVDSYNKILTKIAKNYYSSSAEDELLHFIGSAIGLIGGAVGGFLIAPSISIFLFGATYNFMLLLCPIIGGLIGIPVALIAIHVFFVIVGIGFLIGLLILLINFIVWLFQST